MRAEEENLIREARRGNEAAMETLFNQHVEQGVRLAYLITEDWPSAEDATQEAFIRAFRSLNTFKDGYPFAPWFTRIVVNQARTNRKKKKCYLPLANLENREDGRPLPEEILLKQEKRQQILAILQGMGDNYRLPVLLKYFSGCSEAETAEILSLPVSTVKSRLYVARQKLKASLQEGEEQAYEKI